MRSKVIILYVWVNYRLLHLLIGLALGHVLLFKTDIFSTLIPETDATVVVNGYGNVNASRVYGTDPNSVVLSFLLRTGSFLISASTVASIPPFTAACKSAALNCVSLVLPGDMPPGVYNVTSDSESVYIVADAPGYQLEFYVDSTASFSEADCHIYGAGITPFALCFRNINSTLSFGIPR